MITLAELKTILSYDPSDGIFRWLVKVAPNMNVGEIAGSHVGRGYWKICVKGKRYRAHRLAWFYVTGEWPRLQIDHVNGIRSDNRFSNLREATNGQNAANSKKRHDNPHLKGAHWHNRDKVWFSCIRVNGKLIYLGVFKTAELAHEAYYAAAQKYFGTFARAA